MVHLFGSGHSRILVEEMWPRYGSFPGFNPIVELSLSFHNLVVGPNGQRQAMFLENVSGLAERILRNFDLSPRIPHWSRRRAVVTWCPSKWRKDFGSAASKSLRSLARNILRPAPVSTPAEEKLQDFADLVLDTGAPSAMRWCPWMDSIDSRPPGSTVGGCLLVNSIKAEVAARIPTKAGDPPRVLTAGAIVGA